jgi:hypothetical protein
MQMGVVFFGSSAEFVGGARVSADEEAMV